MKIKFVFPLLVALLLTTASLGADYTWFSTSTNSWKNSGQSEFLEGKIPLAVLDSLDKIYKKFPYNYIIYELDERLFIQVRCTFDLYEIQEGKLVNKYIYSNRGYTCGTNTFVRDNTHYMLGGHGFWTNHLDLLSFDELHGSWELVVTKNQPPNYFSGRVYQNSKGIYSLFGEQFNQRDGLDLKNSQGYFLDWKTKEWKEIEIQIEGLDLKDLIEKGGLYFIQTEDYAFWASTTVLNNIGWNLIEKETGKIFYFDSKNIDMGIGPYLEIVGNVLRYTAPSGELKSLDLDQIRKQSKEVGYIRVKEGDAIEASSTWGYLLFFLLVGVGWVVVRQVLPKMKKELVPTKEPKKPQPLEILLPYSGQSLSTEVLDQLLGIDSQANFDSRRMKRARMVRDINDQYLAQKGKELIVREKREQDKRYVFYKIQA
ncbi:MAG: hypothetical protein NBV61_06050 [Algoriphagus sp.]|nr:hypothetical protein [Algoriphagus sp.]